MMFWIMTAAMTLLVTVAMLRPFLGRKVAAADPPAAYDLRVYRDQLREVDRDLARRVLTEDEAGRLKTEIGRKILDADRALARQVQPQGHAPAPLLAGALLVLLLGAALAVYLREGSPALPDLPLKTRIAAAEARMANRPDQATAESRAAPSAPATTPDPDYLRLIDELRAAVARRPDDPQGLALLAEHEARLGNMSAARDAQARLIALRGDQATATDHARLAALMIEAAGGLVTPEAQAELDRALQLDPQDGQALYLRGLMLAQNDRPDLAFPIWRDLVERGPDSAPWMDPIRALMPQLAWLSGNPNYQAPALPGPDAAAIAAAGEMTPEARQQMIETMVKGLETRLATEGGTPEEWARLITSLVQIGNAAHAADIWTEAQTRFASFPEALAMVRQAAEAAGLTDSAPTGTGSPAAPQTTALPGPDEADISAAAEMPPAERQQMIESMVAGLENRLTTQGGTAEEWGRLVSSLMVLGDRDKAATMLAEGRAALATDPQGLAALNAAAAAAGLE